MELIKQQQMQRVATSQSVIVNLFNYAIKDEFLDVNKHRQSIQHSRKASAFYEEICLQFEDYYRLILMIPQKMKPLLEKKVYTVKTEIQSFKLFLQEMLEIFTLVSAFQITSLSKIRSSYRQDDMDTAYNGLISLVQRVSVSQNMFTRTRANYDTLLVNLQAKYTELQKKMKKTDFIFNYRLIKVETDYFKQKTKIKGQIQEELSSSVQKINEDSIQFEKELMFYRHQVISNKYEHIGKIKRLCSNAKQALIQMLTFLHEFVQSQNTRFIIDKSQQASASELRKSHEKATTADFILTHTKRYNLILDQYLNVMDMLIQCFEDITDQIRVSQERQKELLENISRYFEEGGQSPALDIRSSLDIYSSFLKHFSDVADKLIFSRNNFIQLQKNVNKHTEITLAIIKCNIQQRQSSPTHKNSFTDEHKTKDESYKYLDYLFEQMSESYIQNILVKIYKDIMETIIRIKFDFLQSSPDRKKILSNSMSISYVSEVVTSRKKRPSRKEVWLWKDWKQILDKGFKQIEDINKTIKQVDSIFEDESKDEKQIQKINCLLLPKRTKGVLRLRASSLQFDSIDSSVTLFIPFSKVEAVDMLFYLMSQNFKIESVYGQIIFIQQQSNLKNFYFQVKKAMDAYFLSIQPESPTILKVVLNPQDIAFIQKRRAELEKDLQPMENYELFNTSIFNDINIAEYYRIFLTDQPIVIKGKQYACFADSMMKKFNNYNQKYQEFDSPGPEFFSGKAGVTFQNCPFFSQRRIDFDHTLPKMPFIPDSCHNTQTVQVFWLSHEELHVKELNITSGAPYTENFHLVNYYTIKQKDKDIEVKFYIKIIEIKDFALKGMVVKKAIEEAKWGTNLQLQQIKKIISTIAIKPTKDAGPVEMDTSQQTQPSVILQYKQTISKLQGKNRILIYVLVGVLILNMILQAFN